MQKRVRERQLSEDLTQDTFLYALKDRDSYHEDRNVRGWLFTIARNIVCNHFKREKETRALPEELEAEVTRENDPFLILLRRDQEARNRELLEALPRQQRQCLGLFYQGYKYREIALIMELRINTVKSHISKARSSARQWLDQNPSRQPSEERP